MTAGVQVFDPFTGAEVFGILQRLGRVAGLMQIGGTDGSVSVPAFARGTPLYHCFTRQGFTSQIIAPKITVSGTTLSWQWVLSGATGNQIHWLIYGSY